MNVPESGFCSGCGRPLGLEPVGEAATLACPCCAQAMVLYREAGGALLDCGACGGQFVDHVLLREMVRREGKVAGVEAEVKLPRTPDPRPTYIPCPECGALMNRKNFGTMSGVVVDVCKKHGTWFDAGELPRVLAFVASGGLERARQREVDEARRREHDAAAASRPSPGTQPHVGWGGGERFDGGESLLDVFIDLLR